MTDTKMMTTAIRKNQTGSKGEGILICFLLSFGLAVCDSFRQHPDHRLHPSASSGIFASGWRSNGESGIGGGGVVRAVLSVPVHWRFRFLVASPPVRDLLLRA